MTKASPLPTKLTSKVIERRPCRRNRRRQEQNVASAIDIDLKRCYSLSVVFVIVVVLVVVVVVVIAVISLVIVVVICVVLVVVVVVVVVVIVVIVAILLVSFVFLGGGLQCSPPLMSGEPPRAAGRTVIFFGIGSKIG